MSRLRLAAGGGLLILTLALAGCGTSVTGDSLAQQALDLLVAQNDLPDDVAMDCGDEKIPVEEGKVVHCDFTLGGQVYDAQITMTGVDGANFTIDISVQ